MTDNIFKRLYCSVMFKLFPYKGWRVKIGDTWYPVKRNDNKPVTITFELGSASITFELGQEDNNHDRQ